MSLRRVLYILAMISILLAAHPFPSLPAGNSLPHAPAPNAGDAGQPARNASAPSVILADDFERGTGDWYLNGDWEIQAAKGNYVLHGVAFSFAQAEKTWGNCRFEARVRIQSGETKLAVRVGDLHTGYYLGLEAGGALSLAKWDGATWTDLGSDPGPYPAGQWHLLALEAVGSQLRGYVDGELKIAASDASYTSGVPMLNVSVGEADFDDVWMTGDAPAACPLVPSNGIWGAFGIAFNSDGELFIDSPVSQITDEGEVLFLATAGAPGDLAIDDQHNLYVVAEDTTTIYKVTPDGTRTDFVTSLALPWNVAMGPDGYLYATDGPDIMRVDLSDGSVALWMAGMAGDMVFDADGTLCVQSNETTRRIAPDKTVTVVAVLPTIRPYRQYSGIAVDDVGNLYVGESLRTEFSETDPPWVPPIVADKVYKITPGGQASTFASGLGGVYDLAFGSDGYLYATEHDWSGVSKIAPDGTVTPIVLTNGLVGAADVAYSPDGLLHFISWDSWMVTRLDAGGQMTAVVNGLNSASGDARGPALAFDTAGELYIAEPAPIGPNRVSKVSGDMATIFAPDLVGPSGLAFDAHGDLYVSQGPVGDVLRFSPDGTRHAFASGLDQPKDLAFGPDGLLYVAEPGGNRVSQIDASGTVTPFVTIEEPTDVVFQEGDLLVSTGTGDIWRVSSTGTPALFTAGPSDAQGITMAPDGAVVAAFGCDNSIYRFVEGGTSPGVAITAPEIGLGRSGQVLTHTFTIHNTGNGADGFWLAAESERGWPLSVQGGEFVGSVVCGQTRSVEVAVTIPAGTDVGSRDTLTLTATSRLASGISATARATTVSSYGVYLPLVTKGDIPV